VADKLAAQGYIAIAPDLLSGFGPDGKGSEGFASTQDSMKAVSGLDPGTVTADLNAVADYVEKRRSANGKLVVAGFCWGGGQSFRFLSIVLT
jgi:carboxymethylenebutenolidase